MNPGDVAQSVLPLTSSDLSLFTLFLHAHWLVKCVMIGLLIASVWVWAIAIDKMLLYTRTRRAMDRFEQAFWSGQSLEELYKALSARPAHSMAALFVAAMREWKRSFEGQVQVVRRPADPHREGHGRHHRARDRTAGAPPAGAGDGRLGRPLCRPVRHGLGHHDELPVDRGVEEHFVGGCGAGHRRGAVCDRNRPYRRHPGDDFL